MSKNKKKYNKKSKPVSWAKFIKKFCSRCHLCTTKIGAKFCYNMYKQDPVVWKSEIFPELSREYIHMDEDFGGMSIFDFEDLFCEHCTHGNYTKQEPCSDVSICISQFDKQVRASQPSADDYKKPKGKIKPKPTFFTNNPDKWDIIIRRVLYGEKV